MSSDESPRPINPTALTLAETLLRAIGVEVLDKRLEALERVLLERKD